MWTKAQVAAHQRALAVATEKAPIIERLREVAKHNPAFAERVESLAAMCEHLEQSARTALAVDPTGK
jgi:hypothetical protein